MNEDNGKNYRVQHVAFYHEEDDLEPPPPGLVSKFGSIEDWLQNICDTETPETYIATYNIGLFESGDEYVLFLIGLNTTEKGKNHSITSIAFKPADTYFPLTKKDHQNLSREQVIEKITIQLKEFLRTEKFQRSFMANAKSVTTDFSGEIWSNDVR